MYDIGKQAFELLLGAMDGKYTLPQNLILPVRLLLRESVGPSGTARKLSPVVGLRASL